MADCMMFPKDWHHFIKDYSFIDSERVYTNGSELIQVLRVIQLIEHLLKEQDAKEQISDAIHETAKQFRQTIVRCKDCVHWDELTQECDEIDGIFLPDWFCADGVGRE